MAQYAVWGETQAFLVKLSKMPTFKHMTMRNGSASTPVLDRRGSLRLGVFEKRSNKWMVDWRHGISLESNELGKFLLPANSSSDVSFSKKDMNFQGNGDGDAAASQQMQRDFRVAFVKNSVVINHSVRSGDAPVHNVSMDLDLGSYLAFCEVCRWSIPLLCGFGADTSKVTSPGFSRGGAGGGDSFRDE